MGTHKKPVTCIFVHGWAMNSGVWEASLSHLPDWIRPISIDLPGHGTMAAVNANSIDDYVQAIIPLTHQPVLWVGWSLGAQVVIRLAELYPERVSALFLVAANPCFVQRADWPTAVSADTLKAFAGGLADHQAKTLQRFLNLQVKGLANARQRVRQLQEAMAVRGPASAAALHAGLQILRDNDYRHCLRQLSCPVSWFLGGQDTLVPIAVEKAIQRLYPSHTVYVAAGAGHIPFVSHVSQFVTALVAQASSLRVMRTDKQNR